MISRALVSDPSVGRSILLSATAVQARLIGKRGNSARRSSVGGNVRTPAMHCGRYSTPGQPPVARMRTHGKTPRRPFPSVSVNQNGECDDSS